MVLGKKFGLVLGIAVAAMVSSGAWAQGVAQIDDPAAIVKSLRRSVDTGHTEVALAKIEELQGQGKTIAGLSRVQGLAMYAKGDLRGAD